MPSQTLTVVLFVYVQFNTHKDLQSNGLYPDLKIVQRYGTRIEPHVLGYLQ
jgi:hypothetical protein